MSTPERKMTWKEAHAVVQRIADLRGEWAGIPMPIPGQRLRVEDRYPFKEIETLGGGREDAEYSRVCDVDDVKPMHLRNRWYSRAKGAYVWVYTEGDDPKVKFALEPRELSAQRVGLWLSTCGASIAWDLEAEATAVDKLATLVSDHALRTYLLTGSFLESSPRSGVTYLLRRLRPTLAIVATSDGVDTRCLAALCLHPIAYYEQSWAGAMVPTDDVLAHLLMIRGDEHGFWRRANQHPTEVPEAGV